MKKNLRLLFIDDDTDDQALFIEAVHEIDETIQCQTAINGEQALELLRNVTNPHPDLIFLDLRMPRISGKKCLIELKKDEHLQQIPVVVYTTSKDLSEAAELVELGAARFASKPTNPDEIYYLISIILEEQDARN